MRIVFWGTFDKARPRNRIGIDGLRKQGIDVALCHSDVWQGRSDKSRIKGGVALTQLTLRLLLAYPALVYRYLRQPHHQAVMVGYLGLIDIFIIWPWAKLRRKPIVWDALMSMYNTLVIDRKIFFEGSIGARIVHFVEWSAARLADVVLVTTEHRRHDLIDRYKLPRNKVVAIPVGAELGSFPERPLEQGDATAEEGINILFYGNFVPLHGVKTIIEAARLTEDRPYKWTLVGSGHTSQEIKAMLDAHPLANLEWIEWIEYQELHRWIHAADLGLGIFGGSPKAKETIPNKIYQILATGTPLLTRDSPAIRELLGEKELIGIYLVPPENPAAIAAAVRRFELEKPLLSRQHLHRELNRCVRDLVDGKRLAAVIRSVTAD